MGSAQYNARCGDDSRFGGSGTLESVMFSAVSSLSFVAMSSTQIAVRAIWVIALAIVALGAIDRMKPATPRRPIPVRVDNKPTPLYKDPDQHHKRRAILQLSGGAIILGALAASVIGFLLAIVLEVVGGLLRA